MASVKITDLTAYTDAASTDVLAIVDVSNNVTKKISISDLLKATPLGTAALPAIAIDGDPNTGIYSPGADQLAVSTGGTGRLFIDSSGRVGIGTSSPGYALDVSTTGSTISSAFRSDQSENWVALKDSGTTLGHVRLGSTSGAMLFYAGNGERLRVDSSGRLLVGTSTARAKFFNQASGFETLFQIEGTGYSTSTASLTRNSNDTAAPYLIFGKTRGTSLGSNTIASSGDEAGNISFQAADGSELVELASIVAAVDGTPGANDMPGRLVFSTTADGASSPTERMRISSDGATSWRSVGATSTHDIGNNNTSFTGYATTISTYRDTTNNSYSFIGCIRQGFAVALEVRDSGNVYNTNGVYGAFSDIKLKENIVDAASQWNDIKALQVRKYNFKEETGQPTHTQIGLVAQEVELVSPGLVTESPDRDAEGNDLGTVTKSVNYSVLYMKAVKALQEAMERIETLEAKVAALEGA